MATPISPIESRVVLDQRASEVFDVASGKRVHVPAEPVALTEVDGRGLVLSAWGASLTALDFPRVAWTVSLARDPRAMVVSDDKTKVYISHGTAPQVSVVDLATHTVHVIPLRGGETTSRSANVLSRSTTEHQPTVRFGGQGFSIAHANGRVFVPIVLVDPGDAERRSSGYGPFTPLGAEAPAVAIIDEDRAEVLPASLEVHEALHPAFVSGRKSECLLPRAIATTKDSLLVACAGIDAVLELDKDSIEPFAAERRRVSVPAGPNAITVDGDSATIRSEHAVSVLDLKTFAARVVRQDVDPVREGRMLFHSSDGRVAEDGRSCASCHPGGRDDGFTWFTTLGPRQTPLLAGKLDRTRFGWGGESARIEEHLDKTIRRLRGRGLSPNETASLVAYVKTIEPPPAIESELAERGKAIFASSKTGCAGCHSDDGIHDIAGAAYRAPSLQHLAGTAPYFHDGRYATLSDVLAGRGMGHTEHLDGSERTALEAFLRSL